MRYRYRSEDELKDSGVEWIGKIPKDWELKYLKYIIKNNDGGTWGEEQKYNNNDIIVIRSTEVDENGKWRIDNPAIRNINEKEKQRCILLEGDLLITKSSGSEKHIGKTAIVTSEIENMKCVFSNFMQRIRVKSVNSSKLLFYIMNSNISKLQINYLSTTTTGLVNINSELINRIKIPTTTLFEQEKIANFLDEKTSQFDLIISKKEELIKKLEEAKKSLISEVVTGKVKVVKTDDGYELIKRSSEEMKYSGVEWLGEIPKDWEVKYFKHMFNFKKGLSITKADLKESGVPCVSYGEIHSKYRFELNPSKQNLQYVDEEYLSTGTSSLLEYGDFIFCDTSEDLNGCGNFTYLNEYSKVFAGYHTIIARANKEINYRYMAYLFDSNDWRFQIRSKVSGIKVFSITQSILKTTTVIQPYLIEQKHISDYLDIKCNGINHTIDKTKLQIEKLKEAKQSLISEAVTGKIEILD